MFAFLALCARSVLCNLLLRIALETSKVCISYLHPQKISTIQLSIDSMLKICTRWRSFRVSTGLSSRRTAWVSSVPPGIFLGSTSFNTFSNSDRKTAYCYSSLMSPSLNKPHKLHLNVTCSHEEVKVNSLCV